MDTAARPGEPSRGAYVAHPWDQIAVSRIRDVVKCGSLLAAMPSVPRMCPSALFLTLVEGQRFPAEHVTGCRLRVRVALKARRQDMHETGERHEHSDAA